MWRKAACFTHGKLIDFVIKTPLFVTPASEHTKLCHTVKNACVLTVQT
jgi:hypothetical protein